MFQASKITTPDARLPKNKQRQQTFRYNHRLHLKLCSTERKQQPHQRQQQVSSFAPKMRSIGSAQLQATAHVHEFRVLPCFRTDNCVHCHQNILRHLLHLLMCIQLSFLLQLHIGIIEYRIVSKSQSTSEQALSDSSYLIPHNQKLTPLCNIQNSSSTSNTVVVFFTA